MVDVGRLMEMVRAIAPANQQIPPWEMAQMHEYVGTEQIRVDRIQPGKDELVLHCSGSLSGRFRFEANARDCCWKIDESDGPSDITNSFESSGNEPKEIAGRDFDRLLTLLPNAAHEALLTLWASGDKSRIVDFEW